MTMQRRIISLYTGAGGLDLGFEAAGFEVACAVEMDDEAVQTLRSNRDWAVIHRDIHDVPSREILAEGSLDVGEADVLIGGPPCQPFSQVRLLGKRRHHAPGRPQSRHHGGLSESSPRYAPQDLLLGKRPRTGLSR
jgi:site-specific DNA-cytosine methylase